MIEDVEEFRDGLDIAVAKQKSIDVKPTNFLMCEKARNNEGGAENDSKLGYPAINVFDLNVGLKYVPTAR